MSVSAVSKVTSSETPFALWYDPPRIAGYTQSTLSPSTATPVARSPVYKFINNLDRLHSCSNTNQELSARQLEDYIHTAEEIQKKRTVYIEDVAGKKNQNEMWNIISHVGTCISSATFIVIGTSMVSSGAGIPMGVGLVASGILSIATLACSTTGAIDALAYRCAPNDPEKCAFYKSLFPLCAQVVSGGLGIYGISNSIGMAALGSKAIDIANTATNIAKGLSMAGQGITQADIERLNGNMVDIEQLTLTCHNRIENQIRDLKVMLDESSRATQAASTLMQSLNAATKDIMV